MRIEITPGPWEHVRASDVAGNPIYSVAGPPSDFMYLHNEADAKAISAAPEMLEVLVEISGRINPPMGVYLPDGLRAKIDNALRKAGVME